MKKETKAVTKIEIKSYDIIILGAGPAGLTAALYSARSGLSVGVVSKDIGGAVNSILRIENWPGFIGSGPELIKMFYEHLKEFPVDFIKEEAMFIAKNPKEKEFSIRTEVQEIKCKAIIIATGIERKKLRIPGEEKFIGKGVSYCPTCDSFFFKGKDVAIIGTSDSASTSALHLSDVAKFVHVFYTAKKPDSEDDETKRIKQRKNTKVYYDSKPLEILGKDKVNGIKVLFGSKKEDIKLDGVFIEVSSTPLAKFTKGIRLKLNNDQFIDVDEDMKTSIEGVYAAGDVTHTKLKQVLIAASQGAIAAKSAYHWLRK